MCHVLIIEDELLIALDLEDLLSGYGALTFSFADTQQAAISSSQDHVPDFIVSDVSLRDGTGPHAVTAIREQFGTIPVIFVTATPEACNGCDPPEKVFRKPMDRRAIGTAFRSMAFND